MMRSLCVLALAAAVTACGGTPRAAYVNHQAGRPYSEAVATTDHYFFSGKIGVTEETRAMTTGRTAAEVRNIMDAFAETFDELGMDFADVVQATVYLVDLDDYAAMNEVYGGYFTRGAPARETVVVADLVAGARVEISFIALRR